MKKVYQPRVYIRHIRVEGSYELDLPLRDISIVTGPNKSGKSVLCNLIHFAWTGSTRFVNEVDEVRDAVVYLEAELVNRSAVFRRAIYQPDYVGVFWGRSLADEADFTRQLPDDVFSQPGFEALMMDAVGIGTKKIFASPKTHTQKTFGFQQLYGFMYHDQYTPPQTMYPYGDKDTNLYIQTVMSLMMGVDSLEINRLQREITQLEQQKKALKKDRQTILHFLQQAAGISEKELEKQRKELTRRYEVLKQDQMGLDARVHSEVPRFFEHEEIRRLAPEVERLSSQVQAASRDLEDLAILENETLMEIDRLGRVSIPSTFDLLHVNVCPHCLNPVTPNRTEADRCFLCNQHLPVLTRDLGSVYSKLLRDAKDRLVDLRAEKTRLAEALANFRSAYKERSGTLRVLTATLDEKTRTFVAPHLEALRQVTHDLATVEAGLAEVNRLAEILKQADALKTQLAEIEQNLKDLDLERAKLEAADDYQERYRLVRDTLAEAYSKFITPDVLPQLRSVEVEEATLFPVINGKTFRQPMTASDLPVLRGALYYGLLYASLEIPSAKYPRFLVIDTPKDKGIEEYRYAEMLRRFLDLIRDSAVECQLILTSGEIPSEYDVPPYVIRRLENQEDRRLLRRRSGR